MNDGSTFLSIEEKEPGLYVDGDFYGSQVCIFIDVVCIQTAVEDSIPDLTIEMLMKYKAIFCDSYMMLNNAIIERLQEEALNND